MKTGFLAKQTKEATAAKGKMNSSRQDAEAQRRAFEEWVSAEPYGRDVTRFPAVGRAWPGQYSDIAVQLAWETLCAFAPLRETPSLASLPSSASRETES